MGAHVSVPAYSRALLQRYCLVGMKCSECGGMTFPPKAYCPHCGATASLEPARLKAEGEVYSFTELSSAGAPPEFSSLAAAKDKYTVALVRLVDGPRIVAHLVDCGKIPQIGMRVRGVFKRIYSEDNIVRYGLKFELE